jgi:UDP-N-acetylmuramoylalanine-D-glutamate ligase
MPLKWLLHCERRYCAVVPACASFDLFENYEDRGNQFKQSVQNL